MKNRIYQQKGFENQQHYFAHLAKQYHVSIERVEELASFYDADKQFTALLDALSIYEGDTDGVEAFKIDYSNEKVLNEDFDCFDNHIYNKIFNNISSTTKFSFSEKIAEFVVFELKMKFKIDDEVIPNEVFRDVFVDVCERVGSNNDLLHEYYMTKTSISTFFTSELLVFMINASFQKAKPVFEFETIEDLNPMDRIDYAIQYGIIFMIAKNYFFIEN